MAAASDTADNVLIIHRVFDAPRELVFEAWSKPEHLEKWFGPIGFTVTCTMDFRVGGALKVRMVGHGMDHTVHGVYREIVRPEKLALTMRFDDVQDIPFFQDITFADQGGKTALTMRQEMPVLAALTAAQQALFAPRMAGAPIGFAQSFKHLEEFLQR